MLTERPLSQGPSRKENPLPECSHKKERVTCDGHRGGAGPAGTAAAARTAPQLEGQRLGGLGLREDKRRQDRCLRGSWEVNPGAWPQMPAALVDGALTTHAPNPQIEKVALGVAAGNPRCPLACGCVTPISAPPLSVSSFCLS